jgi:hypothetical protein
MSATTQYKLAKSISTGNTLMETKTIYNIKGKSIEQIENILMFVQDEFAAAHSQYEYSDLKYEDGEHGERTYYLMFKRKL